MEAVGCVGTLELAPAHPGRPLGQCSSGTPVRARGTAENGVTSGSGEVGRWLERCVQTTPLQ
ncbi:hypothetical protein P7K49_002416 [Saguinus oedipus]|uniref:Uncharacterized protein n=1 Tax=Saguinus oedipus TaxID=9490 RepID=A0ABQ9WHU6_SAGOE|nr:hypothetical protein P7K49_002416 [Saguinus oedipus]